MPDIYKYTIEEFRKDMNTLEHRIKTTMDRAHKRYKAIFGVPRGGIPIAMDLSNKLGIPYIDKVDAEKDYADVLVVDDIVHSGRTRGLYMPFDFACIHYKPEAAYHPTMYIRDPKDKWIEYWWEINEAPAEDAITRVIEYIGEDPDREGLVETPARVIRAYDELCSGYNKDPKEIVKTFDGEKYSGIVLLKDIEIYSLCEHHMLPFFGKAHIAYIPNGKVIGVSKLARLADIFCRRLQIQERIGDQITDFLMNELNAQGAACVIEAVHLCMRMRGVGKQNSIMTTSSLRGCFMAEDTPKGLMARNELMNLIK